jgi:hypothetical protein
MTNFFLREQNYGILSRVINFILIFCQKNFILITTSIVVRNIIFVFNLYVENFQRPTLKKNPGSATASNCFLLTNSVGIAFSYAYIHHS